ncbi:4-phosphoerythronate dehydrogenase PdxB [Marinobacter sp. X15-166B]|uniref:4-phosphoerythronate dehydrogenase PdxB n=1 Tax=Marinobacter sp. X15-166B TaxID=1897620 RepID=UPI00085BE897|nr:4-phosphoerythronate dehydrogenase PdxB [Marinobacter sp. X15-166B]OEY67193.1 erythronate-4-phosphate dehydrogenase [Marinobacter sp. X15-166B]
MIIVADENIPLLEPFFGDLGEVRRVPGRAMTAADVREADILLVRSVTRVDQRLLAGSRVRFVGTATIGTDHIEHGWLDAQGIRFEAAPGCNANSVVEYVLSVLVLHAQRQGLADWTSLSVGIVGAGNVGGALARTLAGLGFAVRVNDPPRQARDPGGDYVSLAEALACDVVSLHTPLTTCGSDPTYQLLGASELARLRAGQLLINTGRGEVIDGSALLRRLQAANAPEVVLDVWENEPAIAPELVSRVWLGTPHIAGYSLEGKARGTEMLYQAVCRLQGVAPTRELGQLLPEPPLERLCFTGSAQDFTAVATAVNACYDPRSDDARLRYTMRLAATHRAAAFDGLRKHYPVRREHASVTVTLAEANESLRRTFRALGFRLEA